MTVSLEQLIRRRQDELRGRPEDWRDRLADWWRRFNVEETVVAWLIGGGLGLSLCLLAWSAFALWRIVSGR